MRQQFGEKLVAYPIDRTKVARAQPGSYPREGRDSRAPPAKDFTCPGCKHYRARNDWEHTREIGQCAYPYDEP
eukprot:10416964-Lingulodinium_polyedra.AAC.1